MVPVRTPLANPGAEASDRDDAIRVLAGTDPDGAATEAIRVIGPRIIAYLRSVLHDEDDAHDAFSRFAEKLWRALPAFRGECSLHAWCLRIAWTSAQHVRGEAYRQRRVRFRSRLVSRLMDQARVSSAFRREWRADRLERLRASLDADERNLLALRFDQRMSWREIAQVLAETSGEAPSEAALRKRFERTKEKVALLARQRGLIA